MTTIFICIDWFVPAYKAGGPIQSIANLVNQYKADEVRFRILCSSTDIDGSYNQRVKFDQWNDYNASTKVWYASPKNLNRRAVIRLINESGADTLLVIGIYSWLFNLVPLLFSPVSVKIVSVRGMLHPGALSQKLVKKKIYLLAWKLLGFPRRFIFHATDDQEKQYIQQVLGVQTRVSVAGNFPKTLIWKPATQKLEGTLRLVSIALISPMKNILFVLEALEHCRQEIYYDIFGTVKDENYWKLCLTNIEKMPPNIVVNYRGDLSPTRVQEVLDCYDVFVLPSKSENFGHAIYEALSAGKPVITSHTTPFNNLGSMAAGKNVSLDTTEELSASIDLFAGMSLIEFKKWNSGARTYANNFIDFEDLNLQYSELFSAPSQMRDQLSNNSFIS